MYFIILANDVFVVVFLGCSRILSLTNPDIQGGLNFSGQSAFKTGWGIP